MSAREYVQLAREEWRVLMLLAFLLVSTLALIPGAGSGGEAGLQYGLELDGGTRVRAPLVGMTAENVDYEGVDLTEVERTVADELGVSERAVQARPRSGEFEVYSENVTREEVASALVSAGLDVRASDVRDGVSEQTRQTTVDVVRTKLSESPQFSGGRVQIVTSPGGGNFLLVEVPNAEREEVLDLLREPGRVEVRAVYPETTENGTVYRNETLFTQAELASIGVAEQSQQGRPHVDVTLTEDAAADFAARMQELGYVEPGGTTCTYDATPDEPGRCLVTFLDGEYVYSAGMGPRLADTIRNGQFQGSFIMEANTMEEARELQIALQAGALPTEVAVDEGTTRYVGPSQAERFKLFSLITGIFAAVAVAVVVYVRYGDVRVAAPMTLTALAEVYILLGFAAAISLPLDLAHIAGFIAVIGTGVDDLVIIGDEVLAQGDVSTRRVFQSRFRKAFWVIGAAAATTIVAMSPLMVLSLGDLSGFAVVTIVGVLIGVLVTRPAYGDILRSLMTRGGS